MIGVLAPHEIESMLASHRTGRIAVSIHDQPWVVPINYVYDGISLYGISQPGRKIEIMRRQPNTCFEIDEVNGELASSPWRSVVVEGVYEELVTDVERAEAREVFRRAGRLADRMEAAGGVIYFRISPVSKSGRFGQSLLY